MRKFLLSAILLSFLLWNCKKDKDTDYSSLIIGTWVNTLVDDQAVLTNSTFIMELRKSEMIPLLSLWEYGMENRLLLEVPTMIIITGND